MTLPSFETSWRGTFDRIFQASRWIYGPTINVATTRNTILFSKSTKNRTWASIKTKFLMTCCVFHHLMIAASSPLLDCELLPCSSWVCWSTFLMDTISLRGAVRFRAQTSQVRISPKQIICRTPAASLSFQQFDGHSKEMNIFAIRCNLPCCNHK